MKLQHVLLIGSICLLHSTNELPTLSVFNLTSLLDACERMTEEGALPPPPFGCL